MLAIPWKIGIKASKLIPFPQAFKDRMSYFGLSLSQRESKKVIPLHGLVDTKVGYENASLKYFLNRYRLQPAMHDKHRTPKGFICL